MKSNNYLLLSPSNILIDKEIANKHKDKKSKEEELKQQMYIILFNNCYSSKAINNSYFISSEGIRDSVERMYKLIIICSWHHNINVIIPGNVSFVTNSSYQCAKSK